MKILLHHHIRVKYELFISSFMVDKSRWNYRLLVRIKPMKELGLQTTCNCWVKLKLLPPAIVHLAVNACIRFTCLQRVVQCLTGFYWQVMLYEGIRCRGWYCGSGCCVVIHIACCYALLWLYSFAGGGSSDSHTPFCFLASGDDFGNHFAIVFCYSGTLYQLSPDGNAHRVPTHHQYRS